MKFIIFSVLIYLSGQDLLSQGFARHTYHDAGKKNLKELYYVKDTVSNVLHGRYLSYYLNGNIESRGQFTNNETSGVWEFFYETGKLKMRGILRQNANYGLWEYFFESGQKSMEGNVNGKNRDGRWTTYYENGQIKEVGDYQNNHREGLWRSFFEDGVLKGEIDYSNDTGRLTEYYHSGKIYSEGPRAGTHNVGTWRYFMEDGTLQSEGVYDNGRKQGEWIDYYPDGKVAGRRHYRQDQPSGPWEYFHPDGKLSLSGSYENNVKTGTWKAYYPDGKAKSEVVFRAGSGEHREFYPSGKLKATGGTVNGAREGKWVFFFEDGKKEGTCEFKDNKGVYYGYFSNGALQTKGPMEGDLKIGTWEIYQEDGKLSGYYKPFYDDKKLSAEIVALANSPAVRKDAGRRGRKLMNFEPRVNEFRGLIVAGNPVMVFAGRLPLGVEFYLQERLGHEFEFIGIRDPFFKRDFNVPAGDTFQRGYGVSIKQKLYNPLEIGMWYFGHEIRFTNLGHFINQPMNSTSSDLFTFSSVEQRIEWGLLLGYRISRNAVREGFSIDAFVSGDIGYRGFDVDPTFASYFTNVNQAKLCTSFHFGLNFGHVFSFR